MQVSAMQRAQLATIFARLPPRIRAKRFELAERLFLECADWIRVDKKTNPVTIVLTAFKRAGVKVPPAYVEYGLEVLAKEIKKTDRDDLADAVLEIVQSANEAVAFLGDR
jgi:hypothetical protein